MKEIKAIIQPFMLTRIVTALHSIEGLPGITISDIKGFGKSRGKKSSLSGIQPEAGENDNIEEGVYEFVPKVKIEIVVLDEIAEQIVDIIQQNAHTGNTGDGKIFVVDVENVVKIRTNERGERAI